MVDLNVIRCASLAADVARRIVAFDDVGAGNSAHLAVNRDLHSGLARCLMGGGVALGRAVDGVRSHRGRDAGAAVWTVALDLRLAACTLGAKSCISICVFART